MLPGWAPAFGKLRIRPRGGARPAERVTQAYAVQESEPRNRRSRTGCRPHVCARVNDVIDGLVRLRRCIVRQMAEISAAPLSLPIAKSLVRNAQYAALAMLRGRNRWRVALRRTPVQAALASTLLALLEALDPGSPDSLDSGYFRLALGTLRPVAALGIVRGEAFAGR